MNVRYGSPAGWWVLVAAVLGSAIAFLDSTVVTTALDSIARDLNTDLAALQWVLTAYLLTLGSLLVIGGALGDRLGRRRVYVFGLGAFAASSLLCGVAPNAGLLIGARCVQGLTAALLVPGSLAIVSATFHPDDRGRAIGAWAGLAGVASAGGPFLGGWLIDSLSWRWVFLINLPIAAVAIVIALRHVPETRDEEASGSIDVAGAVTLGLGLAGIVYALIEGPDGGWGGAPIAALLVGAVLLVVFLRIERAAADPMLPLELFRSPQFAGANAVTLFVYAALGGATFLLVVHVQASLGYSALEAGASLFPITVLMVVFSARVGALAQSIGPRLPMTVGPIIGGAGLVLLVRVNPGVTYWSGVFPGVLLLAIGLTITVAPLTSAVLAAVSDRHAGVASAVNNAVARLAALLAVAVIPAAAGIAGAGASLDFGEGFDRAMVMLGGLCAVGGLVAAVTISRGTPVHAVTQAAPTQACHDPCVRVREAA